MDYVNWVEGDQKACIGISCKMGSFIKHMSETLGETTLEQLT